MASHLAGMKEDEIKRRLSEIAEAFLQAANPANAAPMAAYMKHIAPYFGIKTPERRQLTKEILAAYKGYTLQQLTPLLRALYQQPEREMFYLTIDWLLSREKEFGSETIRLIEDMLTTKSWWDTVDAISTRSLGAWAAAFPKEAKPLIRRFIESEDMWLNRAAILHQLHFGKDTDPELLADSMQPHFSSKEFFHQKAIGWALRHYARTGPDWVREFVETQPLAALSRREAMKHL